MKTAMTLLVLLALAAFACGNGESDSNSKTDSTDDDGADDICADVGSVEDFKPIIEGTSTEPTWTDPSTGLMWETFQSQMGGHPWQENKDHCENLELNGHDDWRMPSLSEYRSLIRCCGATQIGGECRLNEQCTNVSECDDESCRECAEGQGPSRGCYWPRELSGVCAEYMSSTFPMISNHLPFNVDFSNGSVNHIGDVEEYHYVRCVRGDWNVENG